MSADNWGICPKCKIETEKKRTKAIDAAGRAYGKVDADEFQRLIAEANAMPTEPKETMREDYEIGTNNEGTFTVGYSCSCTCGFSFRYEHSEDTLKPR